MALRVDLAEPRGLPEDLLVERPQEPRPDERLVVEADRQQPIEAVREREQVGAHRRPRVLRPHPHAVA